jgi:hypothetical protein
MPLVVVSAAIVAACSASGDNADSQDGNLTQGSPLFGDDQSMFQDDRVGRALKDALGNVPSDYTSYEKLFKVGRNCVRADGKKEIYIVEEAQTRPIEGEKQSTTKVDRLLPRAVITGCNTGDTSKPETLKNSFSLMTALISTEDGPGASSGDTMSMSPLEVMAYDDKTGLFNFYVFTPTGAGKPGTVTRFWRTKEGKVMRRTLTGGTTTPSEPQPHQHNACFRCHVNGAPLMNELSEPWTNWISPKKKLPTVTMAGATKELVDQASLADQLEGIIRSGINLYINGAHPKDGWVNRTRDGLLPGGTAELLKPLFCQAELNYLSADTTLGVPLQVFFDPSVTVAAGIPLPDPPSGKAPVPFLFPIRAARDEVVERTLIKRDYLTDGMAVAIRLIDDENDIFSDKRCGMYNNDIKPEIVKAEAAEADHQLDPKDVKTILTKVITAKLPSLNLPPAGLEYLKARLAGTVHQQKQQAYNAEVLQRWAKLDQDIKKREAARKALAVKMFPDPTNPMPILDPAQ